MKLSITIRKASVAALILTLGASLLAGCTGKDGDSSSQPTASSSSSQPSSSASQSAAPAADPLGKQPELTVLTRGLLFDPNTEYPEGQTIDDNAYTRMLKEKFNIQLENSFTAQTGDPYTRKVDLTIASGELPDYLTGLTYDQYRAVVKSGLAMDISEVWEQYASPTVKAVYESNKELFDSLVKKDGKMYGIPSSNPLPDFLTVMWIRQDWLDKVGLKAPTNLDELAAVSKAFIEQDPDGNNKADTIGLMGPSQNGRLYQDLTQTNLNFHFDPIFSANNSFPGIWVKGSDGNAVYGSILPETKAALQKLADMYKQGLIAKGILTSDTAQLVANNKAGLFFGTWWQPFADIQNSWKNDKNANWQPYLLPSGTDGNYLAKGGNAAQRFTVISKDAKNPEAIIKILNIFKEGVQKYVDPKDHAVIGDGVFIGYQTFSLADGPAGILRQFDNYTSGKNTAEEVYANFLSYGDVGAAPIFDDMVAVKTKPYDNNNLAGWDFSGDKADKYGLVYSFGVGLRPYVSGKFEWVNTLTYAKTDTMQKRWSNLDKLEYETFSKIIVGQEPISAFDSFVERWKKEGGDTITQEIQEVVKQ